MDVILFIGYNSTDLKHLLTTKDATFKKQKIKRWKSKTRQLTGN